MVHGDSACTYSSSVHFYAVIISHRHGGHSGVTTLKQWEYTILVVILQDIFQLTQRAIKEDEEDVAKLAIEFWCTIAEEENDLQQVTATLIRDLSYGSDVMPGIRFV